VKKGQWIKAAGAGKSPARGPAGKYKTSISHKKGYLSLYYKAKQRNYQEKGRREMHFCKNF